MKNIKKLCSDQIQNSLNVSTDWVLKRFPTVKIVERAYGTILCSKKL